MVRADPAADRVVLGGRDDHGGVLRGEDVQAHQAAADDGADGARVRARDRPCDPVHAVVDPVRRAARVVHAPSDAYALRCVISPTFGRGGRDGAHINYV